jgi:hypothetical protein
MGLVTHKYGGRKRVKQAGQTGRFLEIYSTVRRQTKKERKKNGGFTKCDGNVQNLQEKEALNERRVSTKSVGLTCARSSAKADYATKRDLAGISAGERHLALHIEAGVR